MVILILGVATGCALGTWLLRLRLSGLLPEADPRRSLQRPGRANSVASARRQDSPPGFGCCMQLRLEAYLHCRLKDTRTADAVDIADAAAQRAGDLTERRRSRGIGAAGQTECRGIGLVEGIEPSLKSRLPEHGKALEERHVVRKVGGSAELVAVRSAESASDGVAGRVRGASRGCRKGSRIEPRSLTCRHSADIMRDLERACEISCLG